MNIIENREMFCNVVATAQIGQRNNLLKIKCPDQYVGNIYGFDNLSKDFPTRLNSDLANTTQNKILLILESPHIKEFIGRPGPAKGKTGELIRKHLLHIIGNKIAGHSELFLINAVQFQCSLGCTPKLYRDEIFRKSWASFGKKNFTKRLKLLSCVMSPLVINACTLGNKISGQPTLQSLVEDAISETLDRHSDFLLYHPSSWWVKQHRKPKGK